MLDLLVLREYWLNLFSEIEIVYAIPKGRIRAQDIRFGKH
jgi:hypothetical protein